MHKTKVLKCTEVIRQCCHIACSIERQKIRISCYCALCGNEKFKFIKEQEEGSLSKQGIRTPLKKIPLLGDIVF